MNWQDRIKKYNPALLFKKLRVIENMLRRVESNTIRLQDTNLQLVQRLQQQDEALQNHFLYMATKLDKSRAGTREDISKHYDQLTAYMQLREALAGKPLLPATRGWAVSPDVALCLVELLREYQPKSILDVGSGFSTLVFAHYAQQGEASVCTLEHEETFGEETEKRLAQWGLQENVDLLIADFITYQQLHAPRDRWYDIALVKDRTFDFVFVDGPPEADPTTSRHSVIALLGEQITPGAIIVLDDYNRDSEKRAVRQWLEDGLVTIEKELTHYDKGAVLLRRA